MLEAWYLDQSVNNFADSFLLTSFVCVTVFIRFNFWFLHSFGLPCLRDVPFRKKMFPGSSKQSVDTVASSSQWLTTLFSFILTLTSFCVTVFIWFGFFSAHSILFVYVIFHLERGSAEAPTSVGLSLVFWFNFTSFLCDGLCLEELGFGQFWFCMYSWCSLQGDAVLGLLPAVGEPWCFGQLMTDSVLNVLFNSFFLCGGLCSDELSFFSIHLMFLDYLMFLFRKSCSETTAIIACSLVTRSVDD